MRKVKDAIDKNTREPFYFKGHAKATFMSDGTTVEDAINNIEGGGGSSAYSEVNHGTSDTTFTLTPNTFHVWDEVASLTLTLGDETAGVANEFLFQFNSGETATTLTLPDTLKWANTPTIEAHNIYQISILKGLASVLVFSNMPATFLITFTIGGIEAQAEAGMTWGEWVVSDYNTLNCTISDNYIWIPNEDLDGYYEGFILDINSYPARPSDLIRTNTEYIVRGGGTND